MDQQTKLLEILVEKFMKSKTSTVDYSINTNPIE